MTLCVLERCPAALIFLMSSLLAVNWHGATGQRYRVDLPRGGGAGRATERGTGREIVFLLLSRCRPGSFSSTFIASRLVEI